MDSRKLLKYTDSEDKCFGVVGMAIGLTIVDCEKYIADISIERADLESVRFTPDFFFASSPNISAKSAWNFMAERYHIVSAMLIGNLLCRSMLRGDGKLKRESVTALHSYLLEEGADLCELDKDEIEPIFDKYFNYLYNVFNSGRMKQIAVNMVDNLSKSGSLSRGEIKDLLSEII